MPTLYCRNHLPPEYMFVIVSLFPHAAKGVFFCLLLNMDDGSGHRTSMICKESSGLQFKG